MIGVKTKLATVTRQANQSVVGHKKMLVLAIAKLAFVSTAGCGGIMDLARDDSSSKKKQAAGKEDARPKTVVVNEGMSKKEEKKLNERLDELEKEVEDQGEQASKGTTVDIEPEQSDQQVEDQVRAVAETYYEAAAARTGNTPTTTWTLRPGARSPRKSGSPRTTGSRTTAR